MSSEQLNIRAARYMEKYDHPRKLKNKIYELVSNFVLTNPLKLNIVTNTRCIRPK